MLMNFWAKLFNWERNIENTAKFGVNNNFILKLFDS